MLFSFYCEIDIKKKQQHFMLLPFPLHYKNAEMIPMISEELRGGAFCKHLVERRVDMSNGPIGAFVLYVFIFEFMLEKGANYEMVKKKS